MRHALAFALMGLTWFVTLAVGQELSGFDRERDRVMLRGVERDLRQHYYDTTFHGLNLALLFDSAEQRIAHAESNSEAFLTIALTVHALNDSHSRFIPPRFQSAVVYGWNLGLVGDSCYILKVDQTSDAAKQGVRPGDLVLAVDRFAATRADRDNLLYFYYALAPREAVRLTLRGPGDTTVRTMIAQAKATARPPILDLTHGDDIWRLIREEQAVARASRSQWVELGSDVMVWKLRNFLTTDRGIDEMVRRAQGFHALVRDLRGNPGGFETTLLRLAGALAGDDTVAIRRSRDKAERMRTRTGAPRFSGTVVTLVDGQSESAAEVLAYFVQMRKRGSVIGDRTAGAVMEGRGFPHSIGTQTMVFYYTSVTVGDLVFADGTRLEGRGVIPDEIVLPSGADLAAHRDPALARALALVGRPMTPDAAGALFDYEP